MLTKTHLHNILEYDRMINCGKKYAFMQGCGEVLRLHVGKKIGLT